MGVWAGGGQPLAEGAGGCALARAKLLWPASLRWRSVHARKGIRAAGRRAQVGLCPGATCAALQCLLCICQKPFERGRPWPQGPLGAPTWEHTPVHAPAAQGSCCSERSGWRRCWRRAGLAWWWSTSLTTPAAGCPAAASGAASWRQPGTCAPKQRALSGWDRVLLGVARALLVHSRGAARALADPGAHPQPLPARACSCRAASSS